MHTIRRHYGEKNLTAFVKDVIVRHPQVDGVKLADSRVGEKWVTMEWNPFWHVISDEWALRVHARKRSDPDFNKFRMLWMSDKKHGIIVEGHREKSGKIVLDSIRLEEMVKIDWM